MGSKGSNTTTQNTNQTQTYTPAGGGYITNALNRAGETANLPFNIPQAPVAGFSNDQMQAFNQFRQLQGTAQPYYNQAASYFSPTGAQQFYNPFAANVTAGLKDIFGAQNAQTTGQLTQAAGGVGADRIAVGQSELARQQGLAAGQTLANIYGQAGQMAQAAGQGQMALGANAQNSAIQGSNALLGTGGLQQQLAQAQMNAPYQQQLAQAAFPYQQAQFLASLTGALAPGLGGTTSGYGTTSKTGPAPNLFSQLLGVGALGLGAYNAWNEEGSGTSYGPGTAGQPGSPYEGPVRSAAEGGAVQESPYAVSYDDGGGIPNHDPIDVSKMPLIPQTQLAPIQANIPQVDLNPKMEESQQSSGPSMGDIAKLVMMFAKDGGRVDPYRHYGDEGDPGGVVPDDEESPIYRMPDRPNGVNPYDTWRKETPLPDFSEKSSTLNYADASAPAAAVAAIDKAAPKVAAATPARNPNPEPKVAAGLRQAVGEAGGEGAGALGDQGVSPYSQASEMAPVDYRPTKRSGIDRSPWLALMAAGAGMMSGTSPYAGVNIGQGVMAGTKTLETLRTARQRDETLDQSARRLTQEQQQAEWPYTRETLQQKRQRESEEFERTKPVKLGVDKDGYDVYGIPDRKNPGKYLDYDGNAIDMSILGRQRDKPVPGTTGVPQASGAGGVLNANAQLVASGPYDYSQDGPYVEKGMDLPEPQAIGSKSARALQTDAEYYLTTGKLPKTSHGKSPVAIQQQRYADAVKNYGSALAASRGMTPEQVSEGWRTSPGMMRFILGADGRATVSLGTAVRHLDTVKQLAEAWAAGNTAKVNQLRAILSRQFGDDAATNLDAAGRIVGPEIIKALGVAGAGTAEERHGAGEQFSTARSPAQLLGAVTTTQKLLGGQLDGKMRQAKLAGVSEEKFKELIGDRPFQVLREAEGGGKKLSPTDQQALEWANANPKDPRAAEIKKRLGVH